MPNTQKLFYLSFFLLLNLYGIFVTITFRLIKSTARNFVPEVYINPNDFLPEPSYSGKIKVSVRKITSTFNLSSGVAQQISEHVGEKWKLAWLILSSEKYSWFTIDRIYWKRNQTTIEVSDDPRVWLETDNYILTVKEKKILLSDNEWINDHINGCRAKATL